MGTLDFMRAFQIKNRQHTLYHNAKVNTITIEVIATSELDIRTDNERLSRITSTRYDPNQNLFIINVLIPPSESGSSTYDGTITLTNVVTHQTETVKIAHASEFVPSFLGQFTITDYIVLGLLTLVGYVLVNSVRSTKSEINRAPQGGAGGYPIPAAGGLGGPVGGAGAPAPGGYGGGVGGGGNFFRGNMPNSYGIQATPGYGSGGASQRNVAGGAAPGSSSGYSHNRGGYYQSQIHEEGLVFLREVRQFTLSRSLLLAGIFISQKFWFVSSKNGFTYTQQRRPSALYNLDDGYWWMYHPLISHLPIIFVCCFEPFVLRNISHEHSLVVMLQNSISYLFDLIRDEHVWSQCVPGPLSDGQEALFQNFLLYNKINRLLRAQDQIRIFKCQL
eukprot:TRINITY_DN6538_c0_g1_i4.p1 TRINITY_DN6538_c0_g1~~TRINITY_DN6538_c0_g1_i4.p1  ORF type:complete len:390 (+),score=42.94 TRINITY_DN6538_c0_g1_i4:2-1171(+)